MCVILALTALVGGCEPAADEHPGEAGRKDVARVGVDPVDVRFLEQASYNVPIWLSGDTRDRVLVWFSAYDCLDPVAPETMSQLIEMANSRRFDDMVTAGNIMNPDALYTSANMNSLAHSLGVVKEIIWVIPGFSSVTQEDLDFLRNTMKEHYPESSKEIEALELSDNMITGTLQGVPFTIQTLDDLQAPSEPVLLSIDSSFIFALYRDEKATGSLPFIAGMFKLLGETGLEADYVSISASNVDRRCPFKFRSLARYLEEMLEDPAIADDEPPKLWSERSIAWKAEQQELELAVPIYKDIINKFPDDAMTRYDLAEACFRLGKLKECGEALAEAARIDPGYIPAFSEFAGRLASEGREKEADTLFEMMPVADSGKG